MVNAVCSRWREYPLHFLSHQSEWLVARRGRCQRAALTGFPAGLGLVAPASSGVAPGASSMALSDTAPRVLTEAGQHALRLAAPPKHLPAAACNAVLRSLLKGGYVEECPAPCEYIGLGWRQQDGGWTALRVTDAGLLAIGAALSAAPDEAPSAPPTASTGP